MGTPYDKMTTDWVAAQFKGLGLEQVRAQQFDLPTQWFPTSWEVVAAGTGTTVPIKSAVLLYLSVATTGPVELEPVWLGMWTKTALIVNCEHTAQVAVSLVGNALITSNQVASRLWYVGGGDRLKAIVAKSFKDYGMALVPHRQPGRVGSSAKSTPTRQASTSSTRGTLTPTWTRRSRFRRTDSNNRRERS